MLKRLVFVAVLGVCLAIVGGMVTLGGSEEAAACSYYDPSCR